MEREDIILNGAFDPARIRKTAQVPIICIYEHPSDYPDKFVARLYDLTHPTRYVVLTDTLEEARKAVPGEMFCFPRDQKDDPVIVESYL